MLKKRLLIIVDVFFYNYPEGSYADAGNDDYYKTGYQSFNAKSRVWLPVWKFKDCNTRYNSSGTVENGTRDIYLFRLAETYLIAAEAAVKWEITLMLYTI